MSCPSGVDVSRGLDTTAAASRLLLEKTINSVLMSYVQTHLRHLYQSPSLVSDSDP